MSYGHNMQDVTIGGRPATLHNLGGVRPPRGRRAFNLVRVTFKDTGETQTMGAAAFAEWSTKLDR